MALSVKPITLWRVDVANEPGVLARTLEPLAEAGADLRLVMGYRFPDTPERSAIEVWPVTGRRATGAADQAGLAAAGVPCVLVEGDNRPGLGAALSRALADEGINIAFLMAQVIGRKFTAAFGFVDEGALASATRVMKAAGRAPARRRVRAPRKKRRR
jgi:hypothetical protein